MTINNSDMKNNQFTVFSNKQIVILFTETVIVAYLIAIFSVVLSFLLSLFFQLNRGNLIRDFIFFPIYCLFIILLIFLIRKYRANWSKENFGIPSSQNLVRDIWVGITYFSIIYLLNFPLQLLDVNYKVELLRENMNSMPSFIFQIPVLILVVLLVLFSSTYGFLTGALPEEFQFRGYLQGVYEQEVNPMAGVLVSFISFSLAHFFYHPEWPLISVLNIVIPALVICLAYHTSKSLIVVITIHTILNSIYIIPIVFYALDFVTEAYLTIILFFLIFLAIAWLGKQEIQDLILKLRALLMNTSLKILIIGIVFGSLYLLIAIGIPFFVVSLF